MKAAIIIPSHMPNETIIFLEADTNKITFEVKSKGTTGLKDMELEDGGVSRVFHLI